MVGQSSEKSVYLQGVKQIDPRISSRPNQKAMADCYAEGLLPLFTVHDELCFSVEGDDQARRIKDIMENGLSDVLKVPSKVDDELKDNWGEIE